MGRERRLERAALYLVDEVESGSTLRYAVPALRHLEMARRLDRLGLLRPGIAKADWSSPEAAPAESDRHGRLDGVEARTHRGRDVASVIGWSFLPERWRRPDGVVIALRRPAGIWQAVDLVPVSLTRPDVASARGAVYERTGWSADIQCRWLPPGSELAAWAIDTEGPESFPLVGRVRLPAEMCREEQRGLAVEPGVLVSARSLHHPGWLHAGEGVSVAAGGRLQLQGDRGVVLSNGFRVEAGGWLGLQSPYLNPSESRDSASTRIVRTRTPPPGS